MSNNSTTGASIRPKEGGGSGVDCYPLMQTVSSPVSSSTGHEQRQTNNMKIGGGGSIPVVISSSSQDQKFFDETDPNSDQFEDAEEDDEISMPLATVSEAPPSKQNEGWNQSHLVSDGKQPSQKPADSPKRYDTLKAATTSKDTPPGKQSYEPQPYNPQEQTNHKMVVETSTGARVLFDNLEQNDICCGRGRAFIDHHGNKEFKRIVQMNLKIYMSASTKGEKIQIVKWIVSELHRTGARFVNRDKASGKWYDIGLLKSHEKTGHAIRDFIKSMSKEKKEKKPKEKKEKKEKGSQKNSSSNRNGGEQAPTTSGNAVTKVAAVENDDGDVRMMDVTQSSSRRSSSSSTSAAASVPRSDPAVEHEEESKFNDIKPDDVSLFLGSIMLISKHAKEQELQHGQPEYEPAR